MDQFTQSLNFAKSCYLQGLCTRKAYLVARNRIIKEALEDLEDALILNDHRSEVQFLQEQGFGLKGAIKEVQGKGVEVCH